MPIEFQTRLQAIFATVRQLHAIARRTFELAKAWPRRKTHIRFPVGTSFEDRFWGRVDIRGADECWPWLGGLLKDGYGSVCPEFGRTEQSNRVAYRLAVGPIPDGAYIRHRCDYPSCCNPAHLVPGTQLDNMQDAVERDRIYRKLVPAQVLQIVAAWRAGRSQCSLAREYGVSRTLVWRILNGKVQQRVTGGPVARQQVAEPTNHGFAAAAHLA